MIDRSLSSKVTEKETRKTDRSTTKIYNHEFSQYSANSWDVFPLVNSPKYKLLLSPSKNISGSTRENLFRVKIDDIIVAKNPNSRKTIFGWWEETLENDNMSTSNENMTNNDKKFFTPNSQHSFEDDSLGQEQILEIGIAERMFIIFTNVCFFSILSYYYVI